MKPMIATTPSTNCTMSYRIPPRVDLPRLRHGGRYGDDVSPHAGRNCDLVGRAGAQMMAPNALSSARSRGQHQQGYEHGHHRCRDAHDEQRHGRHHLPRRAGRHGARGSRQRRLRLQRSQQPLREGAGYEHDSRCFSTGALRVLGGIACGASFACTAGAYEGRNIFASRVDSHELERGYRGDRFSRRRRACAPAREKKTFRLSRFRDHSSGHCPLSASSTVTERHSFEITRREFPCISMHRP